MSEAESGEIRRPVSIKDEVRQSYLDYAMSVIVGRALPDVRDGLKPVHRRVLYAMHDTGNTAEKPYRKSAKTVGEVIGKYHPHGDQAVYDAIVRMAQDFSLRYPLVDGQGNFGSVDGDPPAAMRYTEIRMHRMARELLLDIDKETVDFGPNYDGSEEEPLVLPAAFPNLLLNGSDGIAVGMATKIPPHNLNEITEAIRLLIEDPACSVQDLMEKVQGPDFPTAGIIHGMNGVRQAYLTGRGQITMRARAEVELREKDSGRDRIVVTELPFQVNKSLLIEEIADLVRAKRLEGIADLRDESDRDGIRMVVELKRDAVAEVTLNRLFKMTRMETTFGAIFLAIRDGRPAVMNLKEMLEAFVDHRREVIVRRTRYLLRKAEERAHILEGLKIAIDNLDEVISVIRGSDSPGSAREALRLRFKFTEVQAQAILDMRLQKLTALEREKLLDEYTQLLKDIEAYKQLLASDRLVSRKVLEELEEVRERFGDERRTEIIPVQEEITLESMIVRAPMVVTLSRRGYVKRSALSTYRAQRRGGKGRIGMATRDEDFVERLVVASTHDDLLWFTSRGRVHKRKVYEIPEAGSAARGKAVVNFLNLQEGERIQGLLSISDFSAEDRYILTITAGGTVKKTPLAAYANIRAGGIIALTIDEDDELMSVRLTSGRDDVFLATRSGMSIRFPESDVRPMGRTARGVRGIRLRAGDRVVGAAVVTGEEDILSVTERGYGKRTPVAEYRPQGRGGGGLVNVKVGPKNGRVAGARRVSAEDEIMLVTRQGMIIRMGVADISVIGRSTMGVRLIVVNEGDEVSAVVRVDDQERVSADDDNSGGEASDSEE
jgi:DNA gyrase subunit A